jgi:site-specific DNA recombinase
MISKLQEQYNKLQRRLDALYVDKLDDVIPRKFYEQKNAEWRLDQGNILQKIDKHQNANQSYLDEEVRLLELSQNAVRLYERKCEKRPHLEFCTFELHLEEWPPLSQLPPTL